MLLSESSRRATVVTDTFFIIESFTTLGGCMSAASNIKQFLPGSSRSLHAMHRDVADMHDEMHVEIAEIKRQLGELYRRVEQADNGINMNLNYKYGLLDSSLGAHDAHMKMFAWENYRGGARRWRMPRSASFALSPRLQAA